MQGHTVTITVTVTVTVMITATVTVMITVMASVWIIEMKIKHGGACLHNLNADAHRSRTSSRNSFFFKLHDGLHTRM
jgi:hypothetical protein